jgi:uncharacterized protein with HEPN domain
MKERLDGDYIEDILHSIDSIEKFIDNYSIEDFLEDEKTYEAVIRKFGIIGEACNKISLETQEKYPTIPWRQIISMRNKIIHNYFGVDLITIWDTIKINLPEFKVIMTKLLQEIENEDIN